MKNTDWMPTTREARAKMGKTWATMISSNKETWGVTDEVVKELDDAQKAINGMQNTPKNERTPIFNTKIKQADNRLIAVMRECKRRFFHLPPLTKENFSALGLKLKDNTPTPVETPIVRPEASVRYVSKGILELIIKPSDDIPDDPRMYYGCNIYYDVFDANEDEPNDVIELFESRFTKRKKETFIFKGTDSAKKMFYALRYENIKGIAGEWSDIFSAVIP